MPTYNLVEYSDNYSKTSGRLQQYYRDEPALTNASALYNFLGSVSFKQVQQKEMVQKLLK